MATGVALMLGGNALQATGNGAFALTANMLVALATPVCALPTSYILRQKRMDWGVRAAFVTLTLVVAIASVLALLASIRRPNTTFTNPVGESPVAAFATSARGLAAMLPQLAPAVADLPPEGLDFRFEATDDL